MLSLNIVGKSIHYNTMEELQMKLQSIFVEIQAERNEAEIRWVSLNCRETMVRRYLLSIGSQPTGGCHD